MIIRPAIKSDAPVILELIQELAEYERAPNEVTNTAEAIERDGFGTHPKFGCLVAEVQGEVIGMSLYYTRYSTWKGPTLYLEDLVVKQAHRGTGAGTLLFEATLQLARDTGMSGISWQVIDWNEPAINFYKKYGCTFDDEWVNCRISF